MAPTYEKSARFERDWDTLSVSDQERFRQMVTKLVADLESGRFRKGLRVKRIEGTSSFYEVTFPADGRATWEYGDPVLEGEPHVIWRRIGTHAVFGKP